MKSPIVLAIFVIALASFASNAQTHRQVDASGLLGDWKVDLRPTPEASAYYSDFSVTKIDGKSLEGKFYGTEFTNGRINIDWGAVYFAFTTSDGSGTYFHSGVLRDGKLEGLSLSTGREFLAVWTAKRKTAEAESGDGESTGDGEY